MVMRRLDLHSPLEEVELDTNDPEVKEGPRIP